MNIFHIYSGSFAQKLLFLLMVIISTEIGKVEGMLFLMSISSILQVFIQCPEHAPFQALENSPMIIGMLNRTRAQKSDWTRPGQPQRKGLNWNPHYLIRMSQKDKISIASKTCLSQELLSIPCCVNLNTKYIYCDINSLILSKYS